MQCSDQVFFYGYRDDAKEIMAAADLTVIASRREGFSYVFAESLLVKTPVISTMVPVTGEILDNNYLVPIDDSTALKYKILECIQNPEKVKNDFSTWYTQACLLITLENMTSHTLYLYQNLVLEPDFETGSE